MKDRLAWLNNSGPNGLVEYGSLTLDPMLGPSRSNIGSIAVPHPRKEKKYRARLDRLRFARVLTFEHPRAFGDKDDLVALENSTVRPFKMVIGGVPCGRILRVRNYSRKPDRGRSAVPNIAWRLLRQVNEIVTHWLVRASQLTPTPLISSTLRRRQVSARASLSLTPNPVGESGSSQGGECTRLLRKNASC